MTLFQPCASSRPGPARRSATLPPLPGLISGPAVADARARRAMGRAYRLHGPTVRHDPMRVAGRGLVKHPVGDEGGVRPGRVPARSSGGMRR